VETMQDLKYQSLLKVVSNDLEDLIEKALAPLTSDTFTLSIYFARNMAKRYDRLCRELFNLFPAPMLRAWFKKGADGWTLKNLSAISANEAPAEHRDSIVQFAREYFSKGSRSTRKKPARFRMAILADEDDETPPSDEKALQRFVSAAEQLSISAEIIDHEDYGRLAEFDSLFIRRTTAVNNYTYRFARRAEAEGLVVMDDPTSIVRCTNKVYLAELLTRHEIAAPRTEIIHADNREEVMKGLGLPCILKQPDSAFSLGVLKVESREEFLKVTEEMLETSDMLIGQEYLRTDFDWRVGIVDRKPLYACKYFMARGHWQIYNNKASKDGDDFYGDWETVPVELAPEKVVRAALKATNLIGDGLYGVDLKVSGKRVAVIEVNDNPSIDTGVEDKVLRSSLYERIMEVFLKRMEKQSYFKGNA